MNYIEKFYIDFNKGLLLNYLRKFNKNITFNFKKNVIQSGF